MDIAELLAFSVKNKASDLHLSAGLPPMIRVDGDVRRINIPALEHKQVHSLIYDIMSDKQRRDYEEFLEVDFSFEIPGLARFRVNAFNQNRGAGAVFRTIPSEVLTLEDLGCPPHLQGPDRAAAGPDPGDRARPARASRPRWRRWSTTSTRTNTATSSPSRTRSNSCTPRRSAWSTSAKSIATRTASTKRCARRCAKIRTTSWSANCATWKPSGLALTAAETGHLVFGTLHTSSAAKTIDRIIDVFPAGEKADGALDAVRVAARGDLAVAAEEGRRRPYRGARDHGRHSGHPQPDPRGQGGADVLVDPDRSAVRHADAGPDACRIWSSAAW